MAQTRFPQFGSLVLAALFGICVAFVCVPLLGISSAIAAPRDFLEWPKANGVLEPALFLWETAIIGGVGIALPTLVGMVALCFAFPSGRFPVLTAFIAAMLVTHYLIVPAVYLESSPLSLNRQWWSFGQELSLVIVVALVSAWLWRSRITMRWSRP